MSTKKTSSNPPAKAPATKSAAKKTTTMHDSMKGGNSKTASVKKSDPNSGGTNDPGPSAQKNRK